MKSNMYNIFKNRQKNMKQTLRTLNNNIKLIINNILCNQTTNKIIIINIQFRHSKILKQTIQTIIYMNKHIWNFKFSNIP